MTWMARAALRAAQRAAQRAALRAALRVALRNALLSKRRASRAPFTSCFHVPVNSASFETTQRLAHESRKGSKN